MEGCRWWDRCVGGPRFGSLLYLSLLLEYERGVAGSQAAWSGRARGRSAAGPLEFGIVQLAELQLLPKVHLSACI